MSLANSFRAVAKEWYEKEQGNWSDNYKNKVMALLTNELFDTLGDRPINEITPPELLATLRQTESRGVHETANRAKQIAGQVFRYAVATGRAERDPTPDLKGALVVRKAKHFSAITEPKEVGKLILAIEEYQGTPVTQAALYLSALFFCRPGELRHMEWQEINWEESRWEIPASKMKMGEPHIVPLCRQAQTTLKELQWLTGNGRYVFPSARGGSRPLSENGVRTALRTMGYSNEDMTAHGFRAMARTLLDEVLGFRIEWIEQQLAHAVRDANGRAYNRARHLEQRRDMMQRWADYLENLKEQARTGNVVTGAFGQKS
jgi:integrase